MTKNEKEALQETLQTMAQAIQDQKDKHWALEERMQEIVKINQMHIDTINEEDDDIEKLQEEVEYLRGVIDGAPGEGHVNSIINGLDNRLKKVERELNPAIADAGGKIASWMNRLEKVEKMVEISFASIRKLEKENTAMEEQLAENLELIRKLYVKVDLLEGVKDFDENVKPNFTCIGEYIEWKYKTNVWEVKAHFHDKYSALCQMLNVKELSEKELMALPIEDFPTKFSQA